MIYIKQYTCRFLFKIRKKYGLPWEKLWVPTYYSVCIYLHQAVGTFFDLFDKIRNYTTLGKKSFEFLFISFPMGNDFYTLVEKRT